MSPPKAPPNSHVTGSAKVPATLDPVLIQQVAYHLSNGKTKREISEICKVSEFAVARAAKTDSCKTLLAAITEENWKVGLAEIRNGVVQMVGMALAALKYNLKENNMQAVSLLFKSLGVDDQSQSSGGPGVIQVILPNTSQGEKDVTITGIDFKKEDEDA